MAIASTSSRSKLAQWSLIAIVFATIAAIVSVLVLTKPLPPRTLIMATGSEGTPYYAIGEHYRKIFARHGVKLIVKPTRGSVENIELMRDQDSGVSVALVQSGTTNETQSPELVSLGTLFYEPLWFFTRDPPEDDLKPLRAGMRISLGAPGSGTYKVTREVTDSLGIDLNGMKMDSLSEAEAGEALIRGDLDFVAMSMSWDTTLIQRLLRDPNISTIDWQHADAHVALRPYLSKRVLPRGVADLPNDRPERDITLVATKASLIARDDLHPALQHLLLEAASEIHGVPGVFNKSGEFPAAEPIDLPLSEIAREYHLNGRPFLQRYLPFWLAALTSRTLLLLIPIVGLAYPVFRLLPALYGWSMRRRIFVLYGELKFLETGFDADNPDASDEMLKQLDLLEKRARRMRVPMAYAHLLYALKHHVGLARERVNNPRTLG